MAEGDRSAGAIPDTVEGAVFSSAENTSFLTYRIVKLCGVQHFFIFFKSHLRPMVLNVLGDQSHLRVFIG